MADALASYPALVRPLLAPLAGMTPLEILLWLLGAQALLVLAIGALGSTAAEVDRTEGTLSSGRDTATVTENEANYGHSFAGGLLGLFEFRFTLRLTQALNHLYRSRVFERIQSLPMRAFDDERIGDAVYRLMYDTPSITNVCYRLLITPVAAVLGLLATVWVMRGTVTASPGIAWAALGFLPLALVTTLLFGARVRARSLASRQAGAITTTRDRGGLREHPRGPEPRQRGPRAAALRARELGFLRRLPPLRAHDHPRDRLRGGARRWRSRSTPSSASPTS